LNGPVSFIFQGLSGKLIFVVTITCWNDHWDVF